MDFTDSICDKIRRKNYLGAMAEMRRQGVLEDGGVPLLPGEKIWIQTSPNRWLCGMVERVTASHVELKGASWIDHTGEFWGDALLKGADAKGWSSEYQGKTILSVKEGMNEILFMGPDVVLPSDSIRPRRDQQED